MASNFKLDDFLKKYGEFGPFQWRIFAINSFITFFSAYVSMIVVFLGAVTDHWCATPEWNCDGTNLTAWECELVKKNWSVPFNYTSPGGSIQYDQCSRYNVSSLEFRPESDPSKYLSEDLPTIPCDAGWVYDRSQYKSSIVTDFDLVCGNEDLPQVSQSFFYGGYLVGSLVFGVLADVIGRWWTLLILLLIRLGSGLGLAFSPTWWVFSALRFLQGCANITIYIVAFVIANEFTGLSRRNISGILIAVPFAVGYMTLALVAYFLRYWRTLEIVATLPTFGMIALMYFLPESVRWQISKGKYAAAEKTLKTVVEYNGKEYYGPILPTSLEEEKITEVKEKQASALDLFRTRKMICQSAIVALCWMINSVVYHGLSLNTSNLGVNDYVAFAVSGGVEIPAYVVSSVLIEVIGRSRSVCGLLLLSGVSLLVTCVCPLGVPLTIVAMIGKFGVAAAFAVVYLYTTELYPTKIRAAAMGMFSMVSRIAGIVAPPILTLAKYWKPLPLLIFGVSGVVAGLLTLFLPETRGQKLPDTYEEGENIGEPKEDRAMAGGTDDQSGYKRVPEKEAEIKV
ncbi:organic cation transporter protein-like [Diadema setosum]|uniref:organic cation transporter protein-like n=1 Tax=Diadema setosum TaxID=31175 RepID=UPI003B3B1951